MHEDIHILRLGYQDRANWLGLLYAIKAGWVAAPSPWHVEVSHGGPEELLDSMLEGRLDAAFLSPGAVAERSQALAPLGGWGLATEGRSDTALMLAPQRIDLIDGGSVSIMPDALGSTAEHMLRTLITPYYGVTLKLLMPEEEGYDPKGARLMYGDSAQIEAARNPQEWVAEDMGVAWFVLTGLPSVWEMLVGTRDLETRKPGASEQLQALLKQALRVAQEQKASVQGEAASRLGIKTADAKEFLARQRYTLGENEQKGLARFLDHSSRARAIRRS